MDSRSIFEECIRRANGWIVQTLRREGQTVYPAELIANEHDRQLGESLLSVILHSEVRIQKTEGGYICEMG